MSAGDSEAFAVIVDAGTEETRVREAVQSAARYGADIAIRRERVGQNRRSQWAGRPQSQRARDHDTPAFAVASLRRWWNEMGKRRHADACELFITADAGGSNGYRSRAWKHGLQKFADETRLRIHVSHFPPGTSKWNKIEHRLFCHITQNWRGKPLRTFETIVDLIGNTRTAAGLRVKAKLDKRKYPTGVAISKAQMKTLSLHRNEFHGDWNYELHPR